jgi:DNA-binding NarL/FixJ family response regulator
MMTIRVLLADDHAVVRDGLRLLLEANTDIKVVGEASTGLDALHQTRLLHPDVIVMDIAMPDLNGVEATYEIRELYPLIQVVMLSMHSTTEHVFRALQAGARGYVLKEATGKEVVDAVRAVQGGRRFLSHKLVETVIDDYIRERGAESPLATLSVRERQVLQLLVESKSNTEIADVLSLSVKTVETYRSRLMKKLGLKDVPSLIKFAIQHGLTSVE